MADIDRRLKIKYGLTRDPSPLERKRWAELTDAFIRQGFTREEAGERAAAQSLPGYQTFFYASEADTIEMLLRDAKQ